VNEPPVISPAESALQTTSADSALSDRHIALLWERMAMIYGHRWVSSYGAKDDGTWLTGLADITVQQIKRGLEQCRTSADEWPPTLPVFRSRCLVTQYAAAYHRPFEKLPEPQRDPMIVAVAIETIAKAQGGMRRNVFLPGEGFGDFFEAKMAALKAGKTEAQFEALRLARRGWTAELERKWQYHAHRLGGIHIGPPGLIEALEEHEVKHDPEARLEREAIQNEEQTHA